MPAHFTLALVFLLSMPLVDAQSIDPIESSPAPVSQILQQELDDEAQLRTHIEKTISAQQNPANCGDQKYMLAIMHHQGLGSVLKSVAQALLLAISENRILVLRYRLNPMFHGLGCDGPGSWGCSFQSYTNCTSGDALAGYIALNQVKEWNNKTDPEQREKERALTVDPNKLATLNMSDMEEIFKIKRNHPFLHKLGMPPQFWYESVVMSYLMRPTPPFEDQIQRRRQEAGIKSTAQLVGLHVRHGIDKLAEAVLYNFGKYLDEVLRFNLSKPVSVYMETDGESVFQEANSNRWPEFQFLYQKETRHGETTKWVKQKHTKEDLWDALVGMILLSECSHMVGTWSSSFSGIAFLLYFARQRKLGHVPEMITLDNLSWDKKILLRNMCSNPPHDARCWNYPFPARDQA